MKTIIKYIVLLYVGGALYACCELIFRGYTFKTMAFVGGMCFVLCGLVNEFIDWKTPLLLQMLICAVIVTAVEFVAGVILNAWLEYVGLFKFEVQYHGADMPAILRSLVFAGTTSNYT